MKSTLLLSLIVLCGCGPQTAGVECQVDSQCGAQSRCVVGRCEQQIGVPPIAGSATPTAVANDTCETAQPIHPGRTRGSTRGSKKHYELGCSGAPTLSSGGEVFYVLDLQANWRVSINVESKTPGFAPVLLIADAGACGQTIVGGCSFPLTGVTASAGRGFLIVASSNGVDGDFEIVFEASSVGNSAGGSAGGASMMGGGSGGGAAGGSSGGSPSNDLARRVWESQRDVSSVTSTASTFYLDRLRNWTARARALAGSNANVPTGTLTETNTDVFVYSSTPANRLEIVRLSGFRFSFEIPSINGTLSRTNFPSGSDSISFVWTEGGNVMRGTLSEDRITLSGTGFIAETDTAASTVSLSSTKVRGSWNDSQRHAYYLDTTSHDVGTIRRDGLNVSFDLQFVFGGCIGAGCTLAQTTSQWTYDVTTTVSGLAYRLEYLRDLTAPSVGLATTTFAGTIRSGGQLAGTLGRRSISGNVYALEIEIGASRHTIETLASAR